MKWLTLFSWVFFSCAGPFKGPGKACRTHADCESLPQGYCSKAEICTRECSETDVCPEQTTCSPQGRRHVCLPVCQDEADCPVGFGCTENVCMVKNQLSPPP